MTLSDVGSAHPRHCARFVAYGFVAVQRAGTKNIPYIYDVPQVHQSGRMCDLHAAIETTLA